MVDSKFVEKLGKKTKPKQTKTPKKHQSERDHANRSE